MTVIKPTDADLLSVAAGMKNISRHPEGGYYGQSLAGPFYAGKTPRDVLTQVWNAEYLNPETERQLMIDRLVKIHVETPGDPRRLLDFFYRHGWHGFEALDDELLRREYEDYFDENGEPRDAPKRP